MIHPGSGPELEPSLWQAWARGSSKNSLDSASAKLCHSKLPSIPPCTYRVLNAKKVAEGGTPLCTSPYSNKLSTDDVSLSPDAQIGKKLLVACRNRNSPFLLCALFTLSSKPFSILCFTIDRLAASRRTTTITPLHA